MNASELPPAPPKRLVSSRTSRSASRRFSGSDGGLLRYLLGLAMLLPVAVVVVITGQFAGTTLAAPSGGAQAEASMAIMGKRPASANPAPPPTLAPPIATLRPTATAVPEPTSTPQKSGTYKVQPGDELKHIAATYNVSIWKIIATNNIPNPDSLKIGQELHIPTD